MPLRVIEIVTPREDKDEVVKSLEEHRPDEGYVFWASPLDDETALTFRVVLDVQESENVLDKLENLFSWSEKYRIIVFSAEATIPRLKVPVKEEIPVNPNGENAENDAAKRKNRISREELYSDVLDTSVMSKSYVMLVLFSSLVAVIGLMRDNVAVIIGAMVLAPLLGPNVGLSLATTLGDGKLALESSKTLIIGITLAFFISLCAGFSLGLPEISSELMLRSTTSFSDIILAIVSGAAGIISFTLGVPTSLVGVMVALSLLPPLSACGIFLGAGQTTLAAGAGLLFIANIICLNLAGVVTFLLQGIQPLTWWERERAKVTAIRMALLWGLMLAILVLLLYFRIIQ
ncbi:TIGR00341 family protein [Maridesulfovibrio ferrireducens]|uniref:TIGR00341 family protein n=1 Tax=Maridesulfovibrio ferrireducens TaxID=246191 RepID=A0A1G9JET4_9BACT|nr:TIGR00341 family protein [Maridesulfovibrio ferrireducens]SDL35624.1 TIGR00341 family protein [Maridesulfovibrio ferrireducens]